MDDRTAETRLMIDMVQEAYQEGYLAGRRDQADADPGPGALIEPHECPPPDRLGVWGWLLALVIAPLVAFSVAWTTVTVLAAVNWQP